MEIEVATGSCYCEMIQMILLRTVLRMYSVLRKTGTGESGDLIGQPAGVDRCGMTNWETFWAAGPISC